MLEEALGDFNDDYLIFDLPGQIELYTHVPVMRQFVSFLEDKGYRMTGVYLLDSQFIGKLLSVHRHLYVCSSVKN